MKLSSDPANTRSMLWQMEAYWAALPRVGLVPRRTDVDPRGVEALLSYAVILERVAPSVARFRIAGQHLSHLTGVEVRGMPITALFAANARDQISDALADLFDRPAIIHAQLKGQSRAFSRPVQGQMLLLPLCLENGEVSRAMGAIITDANANSDPQKLSLGDLTIRPLTVQETAQDTTQDTTPDYPAPQESPDQTRAFAEAPRPLAGQPPRLRLVHSADD